MKTDLGRILLTLFLILLLPVSLLLAGFSMPSLYGDSYYAELAPMFERLRGVEGDRLIILGNSDVAFGLDGALLEQLLADKGFDYTVCPFGLYAAVGTSAMLELSRNELRDGDIVVLVAEPVSETLSTYFGAAAFWKCAEDAPELLLHVSPEQRAALTGSYPAYLQERSAIVRSGVFPLAEGVYSRAAFNDRCDMVYERSGNTMSIGYDTTAPVDFASVTVSPDYAEQIQKYCAEAFRAGARVCISFSPVDRSAVSDLSEDALGSYFALINRSFPCPVISDPNDYILESGWFYDSNFHLNSAGAVLRTVTMAKDILSYLGCYEAVDHPLPAMPAPIAQAADTDGDSACFTFLPTADGGGWLVSGLTEAGRTQTALTVPGRYDGKPVVGFASDALAGALDLEELTVPSTVETLPAGLFHGCKSLTRLILSHTERPCSIEAGTFDDSEQIRVFIPTAAYPLYRDGYGCELNPWVDKLDRIFTF